jgi:hypothetical protein
MDTTTHWKRRMLPITITNMLAEYKTPPLVLIVESAEGTLCEPSLTDLHEGNHRFSDDA